MLRKSFGSGFRSTLLLGLAGMAMGASPASAARAGDYVITDFESGFLTTPLSGFWYFFTDRNSATPIDTIMGNSTLTSIDEFGFPYSADSLGNPDPRSYPPGRDASSKHAFKFGYILGDRRLSCGESCTYDPYVGFGLGFTTMADSLDLSTAGGIAFWARAEKDSVVVNVSVGTRDTTTGAPDYSQRFVVDTTWKRYTIQLVASADFKQPAWGPRKPFNASLVKTMNFGVNKGDNNKVTQNALLIDDLVILNWEYVDPTSVRRPVFGRGAARMDLSGRGGRIRYLVPGKRLTVDAAGRVHRLAD